MHIQIDISKLVIANGLKSIELNDVHYEADFNGSELSQAITSMLQTLDTTQPK